jgi:hypothetical protein
MNTMKKIALAIALPVVLLLSACSIQGASHADPNVTAAAKPSQAAHTDPLLKGFGDIITYKDGMSVTVSKPAPYTPTAEAAGVLGGVPTLLFTFVVKNNSKVPVDISGWPLATSDGQEATAITDLGHLVGNTPAMTLLPGQGITWQEGFNVVDPSNITIQYRPGFNYGKAIFDSKH